VDPINFHPDPRLGMKKYEFISYEPVKIIKTIVINDVWAELKKTPLVRIKFNSYMKMIDKHIKKYQAHKKQKTLTAFTVY